MMHILCNFSGPLNSQFYISYIYCIYVYLYRSEFMSFEFCGPFSKVIPSASMFVSDTQPCGLPWSRTRWLSLGLVLTDLDIQLMTALGSNDCKEWELWTYLCCKQTWGQVWAIIKSFVVGEASGRQWSSNRQALELFYLSVNCMSFYIQIFNLLQYGRNVYLKHSII